MEAVASGARSARHFYHASINTRADEVMTAEQWQQSVDRLERELHLTDQPRAVVAHVKEGRAHVHVVWSRIDLETLKAIPDSHNYRRHELVARELERAFGHAKVQGAHIDRAGERPDRTPSHAEMQQAERSGLDPAAAKTQITEIWNRTDSGKAFAAAMLLYISPTPMFPEVVYGLVGMAAFAVAVVGGPLTMAFLALEGTGSLPLTVAVLAAAVVSSLTVRRLFGYSFATWRFHLRGESIRSAVDVGWMRNLTVGRMMRRDLRTVPADMDLAAFRRENPLGSTNRIVAVDAEDRYRGIIWLADAHAVEVTATRVDELLHHPNVVLLPDMSVKQAVEAFERAEADALAVVDGLETQKVIGLLTEQYALRRYAEELDRRRRDLSGE